MNPDAERPRECPAFASELGSFIGDGFCDSFVEFNSPECFFDGGDCCIDTVRIVSIVASIRLEL